MENSKIIDISGAVLNSRELEKYLEKMANTQNLKRKSSKQTYPIPRLKENYKAIKQVYNLLNEHVKQKITISPAGEWLLDNFYVIEETVKQIEKDLTLKKYINFVGISNGQYRGFARIYILATEIVKYTDSRIERKELENYLMAYQTKKTLSMDEIWNIGIFLELAIIENIRQIAEGIYISQIEKYKVESIIERLVENKEVSKQKYRNAQNFKRIRTSNVRYPFVEYLSYKLKKYGKKTESFLKVLEEEVEKTGTTVSDIIKKEHFDIAVKKLSMGNSITSIKKIQRINFLEIFEKINGVEEILRQDPARVYEKMDYTSKELYREKIKEISRKTKISEIYIAKTVLELAKEKKIGAKESHIGYYLMEENVDIIYQKLQYRAKKAITKSQKVKIYISAIVILTVILSGILANLLERKTIYKILTFIILLIPISEVVIQIIQYILSKIVKPKIIPKLDFYNGIDEENATVVVIPTIVKTKEKVQEMMGKLEIYYLANRSPNLYFTLLADIAESQKKEEEYDKEVIEEGKKQVEKLNQKYAKEMPIFNFIYRKRKWNEKEESYLGWERKRGALTDFTRLYLGDLNTQEIKEKFNIIVEEKLPKVKYVITLDADTDLKLNSGFELVGAMAHILNKPRIENGVVVEGYALIQPRVGVNIDISYKNLFTKIFAGSGGIDSYTNAISDTYQDNFGEGIFTGKGIFDIEVFSKVLKNEIPENTVLSHDLLEGSYLRCRSCK